MAKKLFSKKKNSAFSLIEISMVILIIGVLIAGVLLGNNLVKKSRISSAQTLTISSPINGIKESALWLESSLDKSFEESESFDNNPISVWGDNRGSAPIKFR
jgi:prepilin-type N-terminal cleavage/methylation domain-containing protein